MRACPEKIFRGNFQISIDQRVDASMTQGVLINSTAVYDSGSLQKLLGISPRVLSNARSEGLLQYTRKGRRTLYLGEWVLRWLETDTQRHEVAHA